MWAGGHLEAWGLAHWFNHRGEWLAWAIILYGFAASVLPVWLLLAPRDYLSTFLKLGTVAVLAAAVIIVATLLGLAVLWELRGPVLVFLISLVVAAAALFCGPAARIVYATTEAAIRLLQ